MFELMVESSYFVGTIDTHKPFIHETPFSPSAALAAGVVNAQLLTEDFESYAVGDYIAVSGQPAGIWSTWTSGAEGTVEDAQFQRSAQSSQSLKLFGGLAGGPMDILLMPGLKVLTT